MAARVRRYVEINLVVIGGVFPAAFSVGYNSRSITAPTGIWRLQA
jgi:hypothetical protein